MFTQAQREEEPPMRSHRRTFLSGEVSKTLWKGVDNWEITAGRRQ